MTAESREDARRRSGNRKHLVDKKNDRRGFLLPFEIQWGRRERIKLPLKFFAPKNQLDAIKIKGFGENLAPKRTLEQEYTCDDSVILDGPVGLSVGEPSEPSYSNQRA